jgi:hypothetical protein
MRGVSGIELSTFITGEDPHSGHQRRLSAGRANCRVANHQRFNVELPLLEPRVNVSGTYTLTITAASHRGVGLGEGNVPEEARVRSYTATVAQSGPGLWLSVSGPANHEFAGRLEPGGASFALRGYYEGEPIIEPLTESRVLAIDGSVSAAVSPTRLAGTLTGAFRLYASGYGGPTIARCSSSSHQFVLSR